MNTNPLAQRRAKFSSKLLLGKLECFKEKWLYTNAAAHEYEEIVPTACEDLASAVADYLCSIDVKSIGTKQWIAAADELITEVWQFVVKVGNHHGITSGDLFWSSRDIIAKVFITRVRTMNGGIRLAEKLINSSEMYEW